MSDKKPEVEGAWVFLSHSHKDLDKVRVIRNELERKGHNPLIFFLKCLEDDDSELPDLLRREIKARTWFILCDSARSRASRWVQQEVAMIKASEGKVFEVVDLGQDVQEQLQKLTDLSKRATVFLSYTRYDSGVADQIRGALRRADYRVFSDPYVIQEGEEMEPAVQSALDESLATGFVLVLLSQYTLHSNFCRAAAEYALRKMQKSEICNVVPVIVRDSWLFKDAQYMSTHFSRELTTLQFFDLAGGDFGERMSELIRNLKSRRME